MIKLVLAQYTPWLVYQQQSVLVRNRTAPGTHPIEPAISHLADRNSKPYDRDAMEESILWYDLETFGTNPFHDRIAQFAALRTNFKFEPLGEPVVLYCRPSDDYMPNPNACLVTAITPRQCAQQGLREYEFAQKIFDMMMVPGSTVAGFNSIQFDDEFIRNLFYRNLMDPYLREYSQGNSRWDLLQLLRATRDLRPEGIQWPSDESGKPSLKLELLSQANGLEHEHAHDALSDVYATIAVARLIRQTQPRLFNYAFSHRKKTELRKLFDLNRRPALVHSAAYLSSPNGATTLICPLGVPGEQAQQGRDTIICADLRYDPSELLSLDVEEIRERIFLPSAREDQTQRRFPVYSIKINRCPFVAPLKTLSDARASELGIDIDACLRHREILLANKNLSARIRQVFNEPPPTSLPDDPDYQIYTGGFISDQDRNQLSFVHESLQHTLQAEPDSMAAVFKEFLAERDKLKFQDESRLEKLLSRVLGRSFPDLLPPKMLLGWKEFCQNRLLFPLLDEAMDIYKIDKEIQKLRKNSQLGARGKIVLKDISDYIDDVKRRILEVT